MLAMYATKTLTKFCEKLKNINYSNNSGIKLALMV